MLFAKYSDAGSDRGMFKSFQPPSGSEIIKMNLMMGNVGSEDK